LYEIPIELFSFDEFISNNGPIIGQNLTILTTLEPKSIAILNIDKKLVNSVLH